MEIATVRLRKALILAVLLLFCLPGFGHAQKNICTIIGTGDPAQDVKNIQQAADRGCELLLRGNFDFGDEGRVQFRKKAIIRGEVDALGIPTTTITGGSWPFYTALPVPGAPPGKKGPRIDIRNIRFVRPKGTAIHLIFASGITLDTIEVEQVRPQELNRPWQEAETLRFAAGVVIGTQLAHPKSAIRGAVTGNIVIKNSRFNMLCEKPTMTSGHGIIVDRTWGSTVTIENNKISRASRNGIETLDNYQGDSKRASTFITNNQIVTDDHGIAHPSAFTPNGIVAGWFFATADGSNPEKNTPIFITENRVEIRGESSAGILSFSNDATIAGNNIIAAGGEKSLGIVQTGSRGLILENRISGHAQYAIFNTPFEHFSASANVIGWNNMQDFTGYKNQILLRGKMNKVLGKALVNDRGAGSVQHQLAKPKLPAGLLDEEDWEPIDNAP